MLFIPPQACEPARGSLPNSVEVERDQNAPVERDENAPHPGGSEMVYCVICCGVMEGQLLLVHNTSIIKHVLVC